MSEAKTFPLLPMRDIVVFPHMTTPFFIGRRQSMEALENALASDRMVFVIAQKDPMVEKPGREDLFDIGTVGNILQIKDHKVIKELTYRVNHIRYQQFQLFCQFRS